jgi:small-conductance mechanosensitive channel
VRKEPKPFVLQTALSDFYVEYELRVYLNGPENRFTVLSDLNAQILDAFNEFGVQIMSPHFMMQPDGTVVVRRDDWFAAPAHKDAQSHAASLPGATGR